MLKYVFDKNTVNEQLVLLSNLLEKQRKLKKTLLSYLEKVSDHISNTTNIEDSEALVSCLSNVQEIFDNIKSNIDKLLELKLFIENISKSTSLNVIDFQKYYNQFMELSEKIDLANNSYNCFMEKLTSIPSIDFSDLNYKEETITESLEKDILIEETITEAETNIESSTKEPAIEKTSNEETFIEDSSAIENLEKENLVEETIIEAETNIESSTKEPAIEKTSNEETFIEESSVTENLEKENFVEETITEAEANIESSTKEPAIEKTSNEETFIEESSVTENLEKENFVEKTITEAETNIESSTKEPAIEKVSNEETFIEESSVTENLEKENFVEETIIEAKANIECSTKEPAIEKTSNEDVSVENNIKPNFLEGTLLIDTKAQTATLPYSLLDLEEFFSENPEKYSSINDIIEKEYTVSLDDYENTSISRFKQAFKLAKEKSNFSFLEALNYANKLLFKNQVEPIVIAACCTINELETYLDCLYDDNLKKFNCFKIISK